MRRAVRLLTILLAVSILLSVCGCKSKDSQKNAGAVSDVPKSSVQVPPEPTENPPFASTEQTDAANAPTSTDEGTTTEAESGNQLDQTQKNSIAMLNYLAMITQEINASSNSRLFLEEAYSLLINNTNPEAVDERTEEQLSALLDAIESHRMRSVDRDRTQYVYEQNKANLIASVSDLGSDPKEMLVNLGFTALDFAVDSVKSYQGLLGSAEIDYLESKWQLDREEAQTIHETRKSAFTYMTSIVRDYQLPGELALNEAAITKFVDWRRNTNVVQKLQFFESEEATYRNFGPYWLELSNCYLKNKEYEKCLAAIETYDSLKTTIFRKDYDYAKALPNAIVAAAAIYDEAAYISYAEKAVNTLVNNTDKDDWDLRYFAAETYIDLYARTDTREYLQTAYSIALDNVNTLVEAQKRQNDSYLKDVVEVAPTDSDSSEAEKLRKSYNSALKEKRKTELAPVYEPLVLNCDLLFSLAEKLNIDQSEKSRIDAILSDSGTHVFLNESLKEKYSFGYKMGPCKAQFMGDELVIPVEFLSDDTVIRVSVSNSETEPANTYDDWTIDSVERENASFPDYMAHYESKNISDQEWNETSKVTVELLSDNTAAPFLTLHFEVDEYTDYYFWKNITFVQVS